MRDPRRGLLTALLLSLGAHAIAAGALAGLTLSGGGPVSMDSAPAPIRIWLAPAAGGGADGAARESGPPAAPGDAGAAQTAPEPDAELIVDAAPPEPAAPPTQPAPQPEVARWLLEVLADARDVVSTPAYSSPPAPVDAPSQDAAPAPDSSAPVATIGEWQGPPAPAPQLASAAHGVRPPDIGLLGDGDGLGAGFGAAGGSAGHGGGEGGGVGAGVGPGPGGREGGTGLFPVPLGDNVAPEYPLASRRDGEEGVVVIHAQVLADGSVSDAHVGESSGYERLDDAALAAVLGWRFQPALHDGKPVSQAVDVPIRFRLRAR